MTGRKTSLTPGVHETIVAAVRAGNHREAAAGLADIDASTYYRWMRRGETGEEPYAAFREAVTRAGAEAEQRMVAVVVAAAEVEPVHAEWYLERAHPERWGRKSVVKIEAQRALSEIMTAVEEFMSPGAYGEFLRAVAVVTGVGEEEASVTAEPAQPH